MLDRIFGAFVQRPTSGQPSSGLGLGLAIVRELVKLHGGTVTAKSEGPGTGSEFVVELPAFTAATAATSPKKPVRASARASMRVLVVDDNEDAAALLAESLTECGYDVRVALDGPSALQIAPGFAPEVALLDIGLPNMDGYEVARRLRTLPGVPTTMKLVAITGYGQEHDLRRVAEAGFAVHLVKPVSLEAVLDALCAPS
jgi:CheY-like chemotaxis protein